MYTRFIRTKRSQLPPSKTQQMQTNTRPQAQVRQQHSSSYRMFEELEMGYLDRKRLEGKQRSMSAFVLEDWMGEMKSPAFRPTFLLSNIVDMGKSTVVQQGTIPLWESFKTNYQSAKDFNTLRQLMKNLDLLAQNMPNFHLSVQGIKGLECLYQQGEESIVGLKWKIYYQLKNQRKERIQHWLNHYREMPGFQLKKEISNLEEKLAKLPKNSIDDVDLKFQIMAAKTILHPEFSVVVITTRNVDALKAVKQAQEEFLHSIIFYQKCDENNRAVQLANEAYLIEDYKELSAYISLIQNIQQELPKDCRLGVYPGYGPTAENPSFVQSCEKNGVIFIGPNASVMQKLNKAAIKILAKTKELKIPVAPGVEYQTDRSTLIDDAEKIGYPVVIKEPISGGGTGIRKANNRTELLNEASVVKGPMMLEKFLKNCKQWEAQCVSDGKGNILFLGFRECSFQNQYQKVMHIGISIGEALLRYPHLEKVMTYARRLLEAIPDYQGLMTVEFLEWIDNNGEMQLTLQEVNPRLQVEHPETETFLQKTRDALDLMISRKWYPQLNFVAMQFEIARGRGLKNYLHNVARELDQYSEELSLQEIINLLDDNADAKYCIGFRINAVKCIVDGEVKNHPIQGKVALVEAPYNQHVDLNIQIESEIDTRHINKTIGLVRGEGHTLEAALKAVINTLQHIRIEGPGIETTLDYNRYAAKYLLANPDISLNTGIAEIINAEYAKAYAARQDEVIIDHVPYEEVSNFRPS